MRDIIDALERLCLELQKKELWGMLKDAEYVKKALTDKETMEDENIRDLYTLVDTDPLADERKEVSAC